MTDDHVHRALGRAFRDVTLNLLGVFDLYGADAALVAGATDALATVFRVHLARVTPAPRAPDPLHALLTEMCAAAGEHP
jgi:hypothetical protein